MNGVFDSLTPESIIEVIEEEKKSYLQVLSHRYQAILTVFMR